MRPARIVEACDTADAERCSAAETAGETAQAANCSPDVHETAFDDS
jgi:hypothetical protein